jgi:CelD/BcsL family acetyltransferase involved in cellulose biosynthesis
MPLTVHDEPFDRVRGEWEGLVRTVDAPVPFVMPSWQRVWLDYFQDGRRLQLLTAREGERLVGVAPLLRDDSGAEFVGHYSICDYMDAVVAAGFERAFFASLLEKLAADGARLVDLRGVREGSPTAQGIEDAAAGAGFTLEREQEALAPVVCLPESWDEYLNSLSKKDRHELRRKLRRLDSAGGDVVLRVLTASDECDAFLGTFFHLMRISSHHKEEFLDRPGMEPFFRAMTRAMADEGFVRFYALTFDGETVAAVMNFDVAGRLYMYNSGYDPAYAHYAVGLMSKALLMRDAIEQGRECVDFLRGDESYKYDLGGKDQRVYRLVLKR